MTSALASRSLALCAIVAAGLVDVRVSAQTPARDAGRPHPTGTGTLSGIVVTDDADARPIRRERFAIFTSDRQVGRTAITDDSGAYSFTALPAGRYLLTGTKQGFVASSVRSDTAQPPWHGDRACGRRAPVGAQPAHAARERYFGRDSRPER